MIDAEYHRNWYHKNADRIRAKKMAGQADRRRKLRDAVQAIKASGGCTDCGEADPVVLDFDHLGDKKYNVSNMIGGTFSLASILREIAKCEIVCANCHRRRTHFRRQKLGS